MKKDARIDNQLQMRMLDTPLSSIRFSPRAITEVDRISAPHKAVNPFKKEIHLEINGEITFKGEITSDVADIVMSFLPRNSTSRCVPYTLTEKYFNNALWMSRYLANLEFNKTFYSSRGCLLKRLVLKLKYN